jgi:hypothetical protein
MTRKNVANLYGWIGILYKIQMKVTLLSFTVSCTYYGLRDIVNLEHCPLFAILNVRPTYLAVFLNLFLIISISEIASQDSPKDQI